MTNLRGPTISAIGLALPDGIIHQSSASRLVCDLSGLTGEPRQRVQTMHERTGIRQRGTVLADAADPSCLPFYEQRPPGQGPPTTATRMAIFESHSLPLVISAARTALHRSAADPRSITHLVTASCTGLGSPGFDLGLIEALNLSRAVQRTHIGFMGCHAAINALKIAAALAASDPSARIMLACIELCSLHFDASGRPDAMIANALFADGAAACIVTPAQPAADSSAPPLRILSSASLVIPDTAHAMSWRIGDTGFVMTLSPSLPALIAQHLRPWLTDFLARADLAIRDIRGWAVHPGGPRVLESVQHALDLPRHALQHSRDVLREHGNMSSPTVLFILDRILQAHAPATPSTPALMLAFGPGITIEAALIG